MAESIKVVKELSRPDIVFALARVPGGRRVVFGGSDFGVYDVDLARDKPEPRKLGAHESYVTGLAISGHRAVSGGYDGQLIWWDLESAVKVRAVAGHAKWVRGVAASPDGKTIASVADDMVCRLWDAETGAKLRELRGHQEITPHHFPSMLFACAFSPDGRLIATGDKLGHVVVWDVASGKSLTTFEAPIFYTWDPTQRRHSIGGIRALAFSPDGTRLAVGGINKVGNIDHLEAPPRVEVFDWQQGKRTLEFSGDGLKAIVERLIFLPGGDRLLAVGGGNDGFLILFDLKSKSTLVQEKSSGHIHDASLDAPSGTLFTAGHGKLAVYQLNE
jgi:WD40 repeat protein